MKIVLGCLMCCVLMASECLALDGGPIYPGQFLVTGTYAGVFVPVPAAFVPPQKDNSLALFSLSVVKNAGGSGAPGTGTIIVFRNGIVYDLGQIGGVGIEASADVDTARLSGIISVGNGIGPQAIGTFQNTRMKPNQTAGSTATVRIRGKANLNYTNPADPADPVTNSGAPILYRVHAFKQAEATS